MYALADLYALELINLKCDSEKAIKLRRMYDFVIPDYAYWRELNNQLPRDLRPDKEIRILRDFCGTAYTERLHLQCLFVKRNNRVKGALDLNVIESAPDQNEGPFFGSVAF